MSRLRNSNIELLRLAAMFCIVFIHFVTHNVSSPDVFGDTITRLLLDSCSTIVGKTAVCLFFIISIWFLVDSHMTFKESCRRAWILEREVLFYSILCYVIYAPALGEPYSFTTLVARFLPTLTGEWWFVSDYMLLLIMIPFLVKALRALSAREHALCAVLMVVFFGFVQYLPYIGWALVDSSSVMGLLILVTIVCYFRWHESSLFSKQHSTKVLFVACLSSVIMLAVIYVMQTWNTGPISALASKLWTPMQDWHNLPIVIISLTIFMATIRSKPHHWPIVNHLATSAFAIYLITDTPEAETLLWTNLFPLHKLAQLPHPLGVMVLISASLCVICIGFDQIRQFLFKLTVDRNPGKWFDVVYCLLHRPDNNKSMKQTEPYEKK